MSEALSNPVFSRLTAATGEAATVPDYCAMVLALPRLPQPALVGDLPRRCWARLLTTLAPPSLATMVTSWPGTRLTQTLTAVPAPDLATVLASLPPRPWLPC